MKKRIVVCAACALLCTVPAFAAEETQAAQYNQTAGPAENVDVPVDESTYREEPPAPYVPVEREAGRGAIEDIYQYWEDHGYPADISYAFDTGGEVVGDNVYTWWAIGLVDASEARKQEILDLIAPTGLVAFYDCIYTHREKVEAYEALLARNDENIQVIFTKSTDTVVAAVPGDQEKEYARLLVGEYGAVVSVVGGASIMEDLTEAVPGMGLDKAGDGLLCPPENDTLLPAPARPEASGPFHPLWMAGALAAGGGALLLAWLARNALAQTAGGTATPLPRSRRQAAEAVRACGETPRPQVYQRILDQLEKE
ncbi:MAG: hypothetical protein HFF18_06455 [Oscillospiraceae bacterium]|nr:hypothetical protein [Oscillospiraceae bacterium]